MKFNEVYSDILSNNILVTLVTTIIMSNEGLGFLRKFFYKFFNQRK